MGSCDSEVNKFRICLRTYSEYFIQTTDFDAIAIGFVKIFPRNSNYFVILHNMDKLARNFVRNDAIRPFKSVKTLTGFDGWCSIMLADRQNMSKNNMAETLELFNVPLSIIKICCVALVLIFTYFEATASDDSDVIKSLRHTISVAMQKYDYATADKAAKELIANTNDPEQLGVAWFAIGVNELYNGSPDEARMYLDKAYQIASSTSDNNLKGLVLNSLGIYEGRINLNYSLAQYYFLESLAYPNVRAASHTNLAELAVVQQDTTGLKHAIAGLELGRRDNEPHTIFSNTINLAWQYELRHQIDSATKYKNEALEMSRSHNNYHLGYIYLLESKIFEDEGNHQMAEQSILKSINLSKKQPLLLPDCYLQLAKIQLAQGHLLSSNDALQTALDYSIKYKSLSNLPEIYGLLAENYTSIGDDREALTYMRKSNEALQRAGNADKSRMIKERQLILDISDRDKKIAAAESRERLQKRSIFFLCFSFIITLTLLFVIIKGSSKTKKLYRSLVIKSRDDITRLNELKERIRFLSEQLSLPVHDTALSEDSSTVKDNEKECSSEITIRKSRALYEKICHLVEEERLYASITFTRDMLIERLGTNATYLSRAIKDVSGKNYSQFMNSYRIEEAIRLLTDPDNIKMSLKEIMTECGFTSTTNFYRTFQSATGLTPMNYRETYNKLNN